MFFYANIYIYIYIDIFVTAQIYRIRLCSRLKGEPFKSWGPGTNAWDPKGFSPSTSSSERSEESFTWSHGFAKSFGNMGILHPFNQFYLLSKIAALFTVYMILVVKGVPFWNCTSWQILQPIHRPIRALEKHRQGSEKAKGVFKNGSCWAQKYRCHSLKCYTLIWDCVLFFPLSGGLYSMIIILCVFVSHRNNRPNSSARRFGLKFHENFQSTTSMAARQHDQELQLK